MSYICLDPKYKLMSFALVHNFLSVIGQMCPLTYHFFHNILSTTFHILFGRVNMTRVAFPILSHIAFENFDSLCIFLTTHNKQNFNKFIATAHNISYAITTKLIYSSRFGILDLRNRVTKRIIKLRMFMQTFQMMLKKDLIHQIMKSIDHY